MITNTVMTPAADNAAARYRNVLDAWKGLFEASLARPDFGSARMHAGVERQAYDIARAYLRSEQEIIERTMREVAQSARESTSRALGYNDTLNETDAASEHLSASLTHAATEIALQIERDIALLKQALKRLQLEVQISSRSQGVPMRTALLQHRIGSVAELRFFSHDRAGRGWASHKFVRAVFRHNLLNVYNETVLLILADHGRPTAIILHPNPSADAAGELVALTPNKSLVTYAEIRNEVFHPNTDAHLGVPED